MKEKPLHTPFRRRRTNRRDFFDERIHDGNRPSPPSLRPDDIPAHALIRMADDLLACAVSEESHQEAIDK
eukprot:4876932-Amphidinium_carterae.1